MRFDGEALAATRIFQRADGEVRLAVYVPQRSPSPLDIVPEDPPYLCRYTIDFPDGEQFKGSAMGIDSLQALVLALGIARSDLRMRTGGILRPEIGWFESSDLGIFIPVYD